MATRSRGVALHLPALVCVRERAGGSVRSLLMCQLVAVSTPSQCSRLHANQVVSKIRKSAENDPLCEERSV